MFTRLMTSAMLAGAVMLTTAGEAVAQQTLNFSLGYFAVRGEDARVDGDVVNANHTILAQGRSQLLPNIALSGRTSRNTQAPTADHSFGAGFNAHSANIVAAIFIASFTSVARASSAPRKMNGKPRTLLTWFG